MADADSGFSFDVFLSHSSLDKAVVRPLAERLRGDGLRVWLDEWEIKAGDSIPAKVEEGLERSRVLVLCMSANAFGSDWRSLSPARSGSNTSDLEPRCILARLGYGFSPWRWVMSVHNNRC